MHSDVQNRKTHYTRLYLLKGIASCDNLQLQRQRPHNMAAPHCSTVAVLVGTSRESFGHFTSLKTFSPRKTPFLRSLTKPGAGPWFVKPSNCMVASRGSWALSKGSVDPRTPNCRACSSAVHNIRMPTSLVYEIIDRNSLYRG